MKGTIISGDEVLKLISTGEFNEVKNIYAICVDGGTYIAPIVSEKIGALINDYSNPDIIFIKITKEERK